MRDTSGWQPREARLSDADNKNKGTLMWVPDDPRASVPEAAGLFARAAAFLPHSPRFGAAHGYRIFWLERGELRFRDVVADPRGFAIMGRHSRAHVQLAHDETIALRHFVLRAQRSDAGVSSLEVADLLAPLPLFVDGSETPQHACLIEGAFSARLGAYAFCGLPFDGCAALGSEGGPGRGDGRQNHDADDADNADDLVEEAARGDAERPGFGTVEGAPHGRAAAPRAIGKVPIPIDRSAGIEVPRPPQAGSAVSARPRTTLIEVMPSSHPDDAFVTLELTGPRGKATVHLTAEQLDGFVVLGRYERCRAGGEVYSDAASRMHVALRGDGEGVAVFDLASTNGVYLRGERVFHARVTASETFTLGSLPDNRVRVTVHGARSREGR